MSRSRGLGQGCTGRRDSSLDLLTVLGTGRAPSERPDGIMSSYLCSLGTNTVLGNSTNGLFGVLLDDGPEN
jgi:hypothetical protein